MSPFNGQAVAILWVMSSHSCLPRPVCVSGPRTCPSAALHEKGTLGAQPAQGRQGGPSACVLVIGAHGKSCSSTHSERGGGEGGRLGESQEEEEAKLLYSIPPGSAILKVCPLAASQTFSRKVLCPSCQSCVHHNIKMFCAFPIHSFMNAEWSFLDYRMCDVTTECLWMKVWEHSCLSVKPTH